MVILDGCTVSNNKRGLGTQRKSSRPDKCPGDGNIGMRSNAPLLTALDKQCTQSTVHCQGCLVISPDPDPDLDPVSSSLCIVALS